MKNAGRRGFTLIEVLTVISILTILASFIARGGSPVRDTITLEREASKIADLIRTARQNSITAVENAGVFPSYGVAFSPGDPSVPTDAGEASMYARTTIEGSLTVDATCFQLGSAVETHVPTGGVRIIKIEHLQSTGGLSTPPIGQNQNKFGEVFFQRSLPTVYMSWSGKHCTNAGGGNRLYGTGEFRITLQNATCQQRIVTVNSIGKVDIEIPATQPTTC